MMNMEPPLYACSHDLMMPSAVTRPNQHSQTLVVGCLTPSPHTLSLPQLFWDVGNEAAIRV